MKIHIVQKEETLLEIAAKYEVDFTELIQFNTHLASPEMILPGMKVKVPSSVNQVPRKELVEAPKPISKQLKSMQAAQPYEYKAMPVCCCSHVIPVRQVNQLDEHHSSYKQKSNNNLKY